MSAIIDELIPRPKARKLMALSRSSEWRRQRDDPTFPAAIQIGPNSWAYRVDDVRRWIATRPTAGARGQLIRAHGGWPGDAK